jgi:catechol 2,3-dioxygenase-like lactoylglutathione lyase family enzyme
MLFVCAATVCAQPTMLLRTSALKINVENIDRALSFYAETLGFEVADRSHYPQEVTLKTDDNFRLVLHKVAHVRRAAATDTQVGLTIQVNDLDQAIARMKSLNVRFGDDKPRKEAVGNAITIFDPFGMRVSMMHETVVKNAPFKEPRIYNFGVLIPDMAAGRDFYANKLGFVVRSEKYLPLDLPLGHDDKTFAFMLHYRPGVTSIESTYPKAAPFVEIIFATPHLKRAIAEMEKRGVKILTLDSAAARNGVVIQDPFGNISEVIESR